MAPCGLVACGYDIGVTGESDVRRVATDARIEIVDIGGAGFGKGDAMRAKAVLLEQRFQHAERAGINRRYGRTADEGLSNREGIIHVPGLTRMPGGGLPRCGASSISPCWSQAVVARSLAVGLRGRLCCLPSGFGPNRLVERVPGRK